MRHYTTFNAVTVRMPKVSTYVLGCALSRYREMVSLMLPDGLEVVGESWFARSAVQQVTVPASVRVIQTHAFAGCANLREIVFQENSQLETIGLGAFVQSGVVDFTAPKSLRRLCQNAFCQCKSLLYAELNEGLEELGSEANTALEADGDTETCFGAFEDSALSRVVLPSTLKVVQFCTFNQCKALKQIRLPDGLKRIEKRAFAGTGLSRAVLPKSVSYVSSDAFDCPTTKGE